MRQTSTTSSDSDLLTGLLGRLGFAARPDGELQLRGIRNPDGSLRWVWPARERQPLFLAFYNATTWKARLFSQAVRLAFACRLQGLLFPVLPGRYQAESRPGWLPGSFALFTGTPGPNRKAVCCAPDAQGCRVFAKLALGPEAEARIAREAAVLARPRPAALRAVPLPQLLASAPGLLVQTDVQPARATRSASLELPHRTYLCATAAAARRLPLAATEFWHTVHHQVADLLNLPDTRLPVGLRRQLATLLAGLSPQQQLGFGFAHGDFTPWNCWVAPGPDEATPGHLALYDLEFATEQAPVLYDLFHFQVQQGLLVERLAPALIRDQALALAAQLDPGLAPAEVRLAWHLYLLHQVSSGLLLYHAQPEWHTQVQWLLAGWHGLVNLELAPTEPHRRLVLAELLDALPGRGGVVLKLRAADAYELRPTSDVDALLPRAAARATARFLRRHPLVRAATVRPQAHMLSVDCHLHDDTFLSVDLLHEVERKTLRLLPAPAVLAGARTVAPGVPVPSLAHDFAYTWLFYWLNGSSVPAGHLWHFEQQPAAEQRALLDNLRRDYGLSFGSLAEAAEFDAALLPALQRAVQRQPGNGWLLRGRRALAYGWHTLASHFRPQGMLITFSGVDGAGKSTVIEHVRHGLEKQWRKRVVVIRHRPSVLPILSAWKYGKAGAEQRAVQSLPRQGRNQSQLSSLVRFAYYYLDYVVGQAVVWLQHTRRGHIVLYDRYYFDFINDSRRSNLRLPEGLTRSLYRFVHKPRLNFFLYADAAEILRRKQEMPAADITLLTRKYQDLFRQLGSRYRHSRYIPIRNHDLDATLSTISTYIRQEIQ
ncbi:hypothetical protein [Hymenobacter sp. 102]|uniref:hypothetical protein n=1 Tax=Hymenobacter sp. 102 TaxID=3403152 RepID=UPI003CF0FD9A